MTISIGVLDHWIYDGSAVDKDGNRLTASNMILEEDIIDILQDEEQVKNISYRCRL